MNPDSPIDPRSALESSLTALLLGELPHEQAAALHQKLAQDAELAKLYERLKQTINLVRETVASPAMQTADQPTPLKLSEERRQKLLQQFKTVAPKEFVRPRRRAMRWLVPVGIAAGLVVVLGALFVPALSRSKGGVPSLSVGTWSFTKEAESAQLKSLGDRKRFYRKLDQSGSTEKYGLARQNRGEGTPIVPHAVAALPPAKSAGTAIVLPKTTDRADETTTLPVSKGVQAGFTLSATTSGFYDDSLGRAGGMGGGGASGGLAGVARGGTAAGEGRPAKAAGSDSSIGQQEWFSKLAAPKTDAGALNDLRSKQSSFRLADGTLEALNRSQLQEADKNSAFVNRNANAATVGDLGQLVAPATIPPPVASAPAEESLGKASTRYSGLGPTPTPTEVAPAGSLEVAKVPAQTHVLGTAAGDLVVGGRARVPALRPAEVAQGAELLSESAAAEPRQAYPIPTGSYYGGGAYGGYSSVQQAPEGEKASIPALGDVPVLGRLFRSEDKKAANVNREIGSGTPPPPAMLWGVEPGVIANNAIISAPPQTPPALSSTTANGYADSFGQWNEGTGNANTPANKPGAANNLSAGYDFNNTTPRPARSSIVLPPAPGVTSLALKEGEVRDKDQVAAGAMRLNVEEKAESVDLAAKLDAVAGGVEKLHNDFQIAGGVAGVPKTPATAERLHALERQSTEGDAKTRLYFEAKRSLEESQRYRQILDWKIAAEKIDVDLPKTAMVEIVDQAVPQSAQSPTLGERIRGALGGKVERSARVKFEHDQSDISGLADKGQKNVYDPYFIQTESEAIQSEAVLGKVIKDLNLNEAWGKKQGGKTLTTAETMALLKSKLDVRPERNNSIVDIGIKSDQPEEAARIANAVAEAYKAHRLEQRTQLARGGIKALEERFAEQEQKVREAQKKVDDLRAELSTRDATASGKSPSPMTAADVTPRKPAGSAPVPQPEVQTSDNAFSTFSLNVSDVSFKLAGASLEKGVMPEPATVRSEEFINAFDYRDPAPPPGVPVAFAWERAQYPFAQNRDLLRFSIKTAALGRLPGRPLNLVLLLDNSGSMERADRVRIIHEALRVLAGQLQPQDKFSVVTFARTAHLWVDGVPGNQAAQVAEEVSGLTPQGGTNLEDAMNLAYQTALRHYLANGVNRVVLLTDGAANLGNVDPEALKQKVEANRKQGIALDCFGIGWEGYNDDLLEVFSRNGDGRYGFVNTPEEAATEFAGQLAGALHMAASDVKVQVEFNPARVTAYRQIGYAKHQLTKEQFRDNTVDAAEIGAAESGNALYVVEVNPRGDGPLAIVRARYRVPGTSDYHEHEWPVPYTGNAVALEQASPAMRLAAAASAFSEWLVSSPYAGEVSPDRLLGYLSGVPEVYGADARPRKLEWMIRQAKSIAGK